MAGFQGYLIRIGTYSDFFEQYIQFQSYKVSRKIQDLDSYRDANGVLHRTALDHDSFVVELTLRKLNNNEAEEVMSAIRSNFTVPGERKLKLTFWLPEINDYKQNIDVYMPDPEFTIRSHEVENNLLIYEPTTLKFIGY